MNNNKKGMSRHRRAFYENMLLYTIILICFLTSPIDAQEMVRASTLPDLSGMAWIEDDLFLGIQDAKRNPEKYNWPRYCASSEVGTARRHLAPPKSEVSRTRRAQQRYGERMPDSGR